MSGQTKHDIFRAVYWRYREASRREKQAILDEFCRLCGYHRKYAIQKLGGPPPEEKKTRPRRAKRPTYPEEIVEALATLWAAAGYPCAERLRSILRLWKNHFLRRIRLSEEHKRLLFRMSARQMERRLRGRKRVVRRRLYGRTKPGTLLKHHVPLRVGRWEDAKPGFTEIDLVSHSGERASGEFLHSLNVTDIATGWTETRAVMGKSELRVQQALEDVRQSLPFPLLGIDSDNGSEFLNAHLVRWCRGLGVEFTRGRPYKKDDNAHVEQKNWTHVRKLLGYERYDTRAALDAVNALYRSELSAFQNFFQPSMKLAAKERVGSRLRRRYDAPKTPFERLRDAGALDETAKRAMEKRMRALDPFTLSQTIERKLENIYQLASRGVRSLMSQRSALG